MVVVVGGGGRTLDRLVLGIKAGGGDNSCRAQESWHDSFRAATKLSQTSREIISGIIKDEAIISNTTQTSLIACVLFPSFVL